MTDAVKDYWQSVVIKQMELDPELNEDFDTDSNKLEEMLLLNYFLKIFKLVLIIMNLSYLFGVFWTTQFIAGFGMMAGAGGVFSRSTWKKCSPFFTLPCSKCRLHSSEKKFFFEKPFTIEKTD